MTQPAGRRKLSNVAKFWIGLVACLPAVLVVAFLESVPTVVGNQLDLPSELSVIATFGLNIALLAAVIVGLVRESTRFLVVGFLAGLAVVFVLLAGACFVLLAGLGQSRA